MVQWYQSTGRWDKLKEGSTRTLAMTLTRWESAAVLQERSAGSCRSCDLGLNRDGDDSSIINHQSSSNLQILINLKVLRVYVYVDTTTRMGSRPVIYLIRWNQHCWDSGYARRLMCFKVDCWILDEGVREVEVEVGRRYQIRAISDSAPQGWWGPRDPRHNHVAISDYRISSFYKIQDHLGWVCCRA